MQTEQLQREAASLDSMRTADRLLMSSLAQNPVLHGLSEAQRSILAGSMRPATFTTGEAISLPGSAQDATACHALIVVMEGSVAVTQPGNLAPLLIHPGESFGEINALAQAPAFEARAIDAARLFWIDAPAFCRFVMTRPEVSMLLVSTMASRLARHPGNMPHAGLLHPEARLARQLLWGAATEGAAPAIARVTQKQLGSRIGLSRESTNRLMQGWTRAGIICVSKGRVEIVKPAELRAIGLG